MGGTGKTALLHGVQSKMGGVGKTLGLSGKDGSEYERGSQSVKELC